MNRLETQLSRVSIPILAVYLAGIALLPGCGGGGGSSPPPGNSSVPPIATTQAATGVTPSGAVLNGAVNPNGMATEAWFEHGLSPTLAGATPSPKQSIGGGVTDIPVIYTASGWTAGTTYYFRVCASNAAGTTYGTIVSCTTGSPGSAPTVQTLAASGIGADNAVLSGSVNPNGQATQAWFEWGTDVGLATYSSTPTQSAGAGTSAVIINVLLTPLSSGTQYYYRVAASNATGTSTGSIVTFTTSLPAIPPTVATLGATNIGVDNAIVNGHVNPNGLPTTAYFEWGTDSGLGAASATQGQSIGSGYTNVAVNAVLPGLTDNTTYYYRVVGTNSAGTSSGGIGSFTTAAVPGISGSLDNSFGNLGTVVVSFGGTEEEARSIALQADGKVLVGGFADLTGGRRFALLRLNGDGTLDSSFGSNGIVTTAFDNSSWDIINSLAVQQDGKIVAAGGYNEFALVRYNSDGSPDTGFGVGGRVRTDAGVTQSAAYSVALQSNGKIVAAGWSDQYGPYGARFTLIRYNPDGSLDAGFGTGGIVQTLVAGYTATVRSIAVQPDGRIVAAGYAYSGLNFDFAVARFHADGSTDASFGDNGAVIIPVGGGDDSCFAVRLQADGKILAAGDSVTGSVGDFALVRITAQGSLDPAFGSGGKITTDFGSVNNRAYGLALQPDGRSIAAGFAFNQGFALARYNADGSLDASFGIGGRVTTNAGNLTGAWAVAVQGDGKIVAAGFSSTGNKDFAIARFLP